MVLILWSFSSSPSLYFCHSVMPPFLSLYITLPFLSLYHAVSVHCFAGTLLRPFFFCYFAWCLVFGWWENMGKQREIYIFLFWYDLWIYTWFWVFFFFCLVLGVWMMRKCGKPKGNWLFLFLWSVWFLRNWKQPKAGRTKLIEIQLVRCRCSSLTVWCRCQIW